MEGRPRRHSFTVPTVQAGTATSGEIMEDSARKRSLARLKHLVSSSMTLIAKELPSLRYALCTQQLTQSITELSFAAAAVADTENIVILLGTFAFQKQRPQHNMAYIHSKPVVYTNNGSGRDSYISTNSGGLRSDYRPAHGKRTFYSNLRQYEQRASPNRGVSHTATL